MKDHVQAAVIGGGVVGCSVLYHLTKLGWNDVCLIERSELTSGSTWHAAGGFHTLNGDPNVAKLQDYTIRLYAEIEELSGQSCGLHMTGGVMLAGTQDRLDFLKMARGKARYLGLQDMEIISVDEAAELFPLMDKSKFVGAMYNADEGHLDPSGTTHAYAKAARMQGAEIYLRNRVVDLQHRPDGTWDVITEQGSIHAEHVVNAGGLWARECGRMVGLELPVLAMEHMYILTEDMPEVAEINASSGKEVLHAIDFEGEIYMRQERGGMLMGTYERAGKPWQESETPWDFGQELLQPDLDRIVPSLEVGFSHFPAFERAGIKQIINGPFTFAPDGNPLVGPVRGLENYWCACAVMAGFSQGGGVGLALAGWMVNGDPGFDVWGMDVARFGSWADMPYTNAKVRENYPRRFRIRYPNEELTAARQHRTSPLYETLKTRGAVFGAVASIEHALWHAPEGVQPAEDATFRRSNAFPIVAEECKAVRGGVGLIETSTFAKYEVSGPSAGAWLDGLMAGRLPKPGRMALNPLLNAHGRLVGDFTVAALTSDRFFIFGSGVAEDYHMRLFLAQMPASGVEIVSHGLGMTGLSLAGPKSRDVLARVVAIDVSADAFKFMSFAEVAVAGVPALVGRVTFTGDLGFEIWCKAEHQVALFEALMAAGAEDGIQLFGARALKSLSIEKGFGSWATEYRPIYGALETGLDRFVRYDKPAFMGRDAALAERDAGPKRKLCLFDVDASDADCIGDEAIWCHGEVIGWVTSGAYGHSVGKSLALGYVDATKAGDAIDFEIEIIGDKRPAKCLSAPPFDPSGARMRA